MITKSEAEEMINSLIAENAKIKAENIKLKDTARQLIVRIAHGHFDKETFDKLWYFDKFELARTISHEFNLKEQEDAD